MVAAADGHHQAAMTDDGEKGGCKGSAEWAVSASQLVHAADTAAVWVELACVPATVRGGGKDSSKTAICSSQVACHVLRRWTWSLGMWSLVSVITAPSVTRRL